MSLESYSKVPLKQFPLLSEWGGRSGRTTEDGLPRFKVGLDDKAWKARPDNFPVAHGR